MTTLTLKINERNKTGKAFLELVDFFNSKDKKVVEVVQDQSPYNPEFVKKIRKSEQEIREGKVTRISSRKELSTFLGLSDEA